MMTNVIQDAIEKNNVIFTKKWEATHDQINHHSEDILLLKNCVVDLEALLGLQQTTLQSCQNTIAGLEETVAKLTTSVTLGVRGPGNQRKHLEYIAGSG